MMGYSLVVLTILISYSACSFGVQLGFNPNTILNFGPGENITITCSGDDEIMWDVATTPTGKYFIRDETPNRKILEVRNAKLYDGAVCRCHLKKDENDFIKISILPDYERFGLNIVLGDPSTHYNH
ncbi:uncharacterized protein LOC135838342 isoform X2 [Planococcus citri]|uniref:uncharacterized protein LOC135838342 isoform X2 n=1 Tax=Planococcus citri TaxID=170843 RepID=UPI0031F92DA2